MTSGAAITGVGYTPFSKESGKSVLALARDACRAALDDAGLPASDVDGIASFMLNDDSVPCQAVATVLAVPQLRFALDLNLGGQAPCHLVWQARNAIAAGQARHILVFRAMNGRSAAQVGSMQFPGLGGQYRYPIGYGAYLMYIAMWARRFLHETGQNEQDLAAVAIAQRRYAARNARAIRGREIELDEYLEAPFVVDPFRRHDCTSEIDGACAVLVSSLDAARDLRHRPALVASGAYRAGSAPGLDIGDHLTWSDYTRNYTSHLREDLFSSAGLAPRDLDFAEIYDCFTSTVLMGMEGLGLCGRGESGAFVASGATGQNGSLPTNTNGGLLAEGYLHGMNTVAEAALQIMGRCGDRQVARHESCVVTSGALMDGSALVLTTA